MWPAFGNAGIAGPPMFPGMATNFGRAAWSAGQAKPATAVSASATATGAAGRSSREPFICYSCGQEGHTAKNCPDRKQK